MIQPVLTQQRSTQSRRSEAKVRGEQKTYSDAIWDAIRNAPPGKILESIRNVRTPREALLVKKALVAYEAAGLGEESEAVIRILSRFRTLTHSEALTVKEALPSSQVGANFWSWFIARSQAKEKVAEARREAEEQARRRRVVAAREKSKSAVRPRKGGAA